MKAERDRLLMEMEEEQNRLRLERSQSISKGRQPQYSQDVFLTLFKFIFVNLKNDFIFGRVQEQNASYHKYREMKNSIEMNSSNHLKMCFSALFL